MKLRNIFKRKKTLTDLELELRDLPFYIWIKIHNDIVFCRNENCGKEIYKYTGNYKGKIKSKDFQPLSDEVPEPISCTRILCPFCKSDIAGKKLI